VSSTILLSRKTIITRSGAGQMIASQAKFLRDRGYDVGVCCAKFGRGSAGEFDGIRHWSIPRPINALLSSRSRERIYVSRVARLRGDGLLIDHGESIVDADIAYVHNYLAPAYASRMPDYISNERLPWRGHGTRTTLIANSEMVREAVIETLDMPKDRVVVIYPGYDDSRFSPAARNSLRDTTRGDLGIEPDELLVGLVTSGDFRKRGLDRFLECFTTLHARISQLRGLVVGGRRTPSILASDPNFLDGRVVHCPSTAAPERLTAALDLVLYPARYEEFGIVVLEAMAMGIPVITSSAVGAAELLNKAAAGLVIDAEQDSAEAYNERTIEMLASNETAKRRLSTALSDLAQIYSHGSHNARQAALIERIGG
jgi:UDP-glucose:(heptosyl)LPS alpha-1,3-glucosyltransferase